MTEEAIFNEALALAPADRAAFLDRACPHDSGLRAAVEGLLRANVGASGFLETPPSGLSPTVAMPVAEHPGTQIGPYKRLQQIGEGGMGVVFMAEQEQPLRRKVALKIIKPGLDSKAVIARFEAERQALAMMDHVNIARVLDGGTTPTGRPYFVMELVQGVPITKYCDDHHLTPRERLELFIPVCQAIQHAHQKGVIHRDIKPSNVLVTLYDGKPVPKIIDFGVAKATEQKLTERTLFTNFGTMVGTLEYMSPEQAEMSALGVDTRSDIYSLGVLLYQLLTGSTPLSRQQLKEAGFAEVLRIIKEEEPQKPSTRLIDSGEALASISAMRKMEPARLTKLVRGELDWIVMKTLEKDRNRRYETANGLAVDVQRYLAGEAVTAVPPTASYRLRKFLRSHCKSVAVVSAILLLLLGGIVGTAWGLIEASQQRDAAYAAAESEKKARQTAQEREAESKAILTFVLKHIFEAARPRDEEGGLGRDVKLAEAINNALKFVSASFTDQPNIEAKVRVTLGNSFLTLGDPQKAVEQFEAAQALYNKCLGPKSRPALACLSSLGSCFLNQGHPHEALKQFQHVVALQKEVLSENDDDTLSSMDQLAVCLRHCGRIRDAIDLHLTTLKASESTRGTEHSKTLGCRVNLAVDFYAEGRVRDAADHFQAVLNIVKVKYPDRLNLRVICMGNLANAASYLGQFHEAVKLHEETLEIRQATLGPDHPTTLRNRSNLASALSQAKQIEKALILELETLRLSKEKLSVKHPQTLQSMNNVGLYYQELGNLKKALEIDEETLGFETEVYGADKPQTLGTMVNLANVYKELDRLEEAQRTYRAALEHMRVKMPRHAFTFICMNNLAHCYFRMGEMDQARQLFEETLRLRREVLSPSHPHTLETIRLLIPCYQALRQWEKVINLREDLLEVNKAKRGHDDPETLGSLVNLAGAHKDAGRFEEAIVHYQKALESLRTRMPKHSYTMICIHDLAAALYNLRRFRESLQLHEEALRLREETLGKQNPDTISSMCSLSWLLSNCPEASIRDVKRAVQLAKAASQAAPASSDGWLALGAASYRANELQTAHQALRKSIELRKGSDCFHQFFLAMTLWRLGSKENAVKEYEQGVRLMKKSHLKGDVIPLLHTEAASVLERNEATSAK